MKRRIIIILLLTLVLLVSMAVPAFAAEQGSTVPALRISLFAAPQHSFIVVENLSSSTFTIKGTTVQAFDVITIGTFLEEPHVDINREKNYISTYNPLVALTCSFYADEVSEIISIINSKCNSYGTYDYETNNCVHFAMSIWNSIVPASGRFTFSFNWNTGLSDLEERDYNYNRFVDVISTKTGYYDSSPVLPF